MAAAFPDKSDAASDYEQRDRDAALAVRRPASGLEYTGHCHWCGDITGGGQRFCDADCRDDWQRHRARHNLPE